MCIFLPSGPLTVKMAARRWLRAVLGLQNSVVLQHSLGIITQQLPSTCHMKRICSSNAKCCKPNPIVNPENESLLGNLNLMGVDLKKVRQRQPGVLCKALTNEKGLAQFLQGKGASHREIASIISRYPRAITRSVEHLERRWELWRNILKTDAEILGILTRSPESFFRSSDHGNMEKNIAFLLSLGLNTQHLSRLLTTAPRTFSNSIELNKQMVEFLEDTCAEFGGKNPEQFPKAVLSRNIYILIRSIKRVKKNIDILRISLELSDSEVLGLLQGPGAKVLNFSNEYLNSNLNSLQQKIVSLGCQDADFKKMVIGYPAVLYLGQDTLNSKLVCLLKGGITMKQIVEKPRVLDYSTENLTRRLVELKRVGYDFKMSGISVLDSSQKRFSARIDKLAAS